MAARKSRPAKPARPSTALVPLPDGAKADEAQATFKNGVLEVVVPAPERKIPQGRRIEIRLSKGQRRPPPQPARP